MAQVFISYSRVDGAFVELFIKRLQRAFPDLKIWHDQAPHGLIGGGNWWHDILQAIAVSDVFIYLLSNESINSLYCQAEFTEARRLQKCIITVQVRDRTKLTDELDDIQFINMKDGVDSPDAFASLVAAVNLRLREVANTRKPRPLWKTATPRPSKEVTSSRLADAPDVTTPALSKPAGEIEAKRLQREAEQRQTRLTLFGLGGTLVVTIVASLMGLIPWLTERAENAAATQAAPPSGFQQLQTPEAHLTQAAGTPTTLVIPSVSNTSLPPTATPTITLLPTDPPDPMQSALTPITRNAEWTPVEQDFNSVTMVLVPAGSFEMGSTSEEINFAFEMCQQAADNNSECQRSWIEDEAQNGDNTQTFQPFWIDQTEVSRSQYQQCVGAGVCEQTPASEYSTEGNQPVNQVTWFQAQAYCEWRGTRLPTEAEWEYAARGPDRLIFPWGNEFDGSSANHCDSRCGSASWASNFDFVNEENDDGFTVTSPIGSLPEGVSWVGAFDLAGNVWEWTSSLDKKYPYGADHESDSDISSERVLRGGSFYSVSDDLRSATRGSNAPNVDNGNLGFRCARSYG